MPYCLIDPAISKRKFERELNELAGILPQMRKNGWIVEEANFPIIRVTFLVATLNPPVAHLTIELDYSNYNLLPPSIKIIHPLSFQPHLVKGLQTNGGSEINIVIESHPKTKLPFICLPGVQEYHSHPQHNGDAWDLYRYNMSSSLYSLIYNIWISCVQWINTYYCTALIDIDGSPKPITILTKNIQLGRAQYPVTERQLNNV